MKTENTQEALLSSSLSLISSDRTANKPENVTQELWDAAHQIIETAQLIRNKKEREKKDDVQPVSEK